MVNWLNYCRLLVLSGRVGVGWDVEGMKVRVVGGCGEMEEGVGLE